MMTGKILLKRNSKNFGAGFCLLKIELPELVHKIPLLHPNELAYFSTLKYDKRKLSYLLGRIAAKKAICEIIEPQPISSFYIDFGIFQFPVVKNCNTTNIQVCISHCDNIGTALAFPEEHPLGIDIEKIDADKMNAIKTQISAKEFDLLADNNLTEVNGGTIVWTIKEALSKVFRTGMTLDFSVLEIESLKKDGRFYVSSFRYCAQYKAITCQAGDYVCSIIIPKNTEPGLDIFWDTFIQTAATKTAIIKMS